MVAATSNARSLLAACSQFGHAHEDWRVVEVSGPGASSERSSLAAGTTVALEEDPLALSRRDAQVRLFGKVTQRAGLQRDNPAVGWCLGWA